MHEGVLVEIHVEAAHKVGLVLPFALHGNWRHLLPDRNTVEDLA